MKIWITSLLVIFVGVFSVRAEDIPPTKLPEQPMKICVMGTAVEQDGTADALVGTLRAGELITIEALLPEKAKKVREDKDKAKKLGFTHILIVKATHSASIFSRDPATKLHRATLTLQLYDVTRGVVCKTWIRRGIVVSGANVNDNDPDVKSRALHDVAENAADIFEKPKQKEEKK